MPTEAQLRAALHQLVEGTPVADDVLGRLQLAPSKPSRAGRRPVVLVVTVGVVLTLVGVVALPYLTRRTAPDPADQRVPGHWAMVSQIEPPAGWTLSTRTISGTFETTSLVDASGKGVCRIEVDGRGVDPQRPIPASTHGVTVGTQPGLYQSVPDQQAAVYWHYREQAWASVSCTLPPFGLGGARTPDETREVIIRLAETVTYGAYPLPLPVRIGQLPDGYRVQSAEYVDEMQFRSWGITLAPAHAGPTTSVISLGPSNETIEDPNTHVGDYPASFTTQAIHWPVTKAPRTELTYTSLCVPSAPVGFCVGASNTSDDDPESRREPFRTLAEQLSYAASPTDPSTWFEATTALPS